MPMPFKPEQNEKSTTYENRTFIFRIFMCSKKYHDDFVFA